MRLPAFIAALAVGLWLCGSPSVFAENPAPSGDVFDRTQLPIPLPAFEGKIGKTYKESGEDWPKVPSPPQGAPNIVVILLDDVGFGQPSTFGGLIPPPRLDQLACDYAGGGEGKGGKVTIKVDGAQVAQGDIPATVAARFGVHPFDIGQDSGQPVTFDYKPPFKFDGEIGKVVIDLKS